MSDDKTVKGNYYQDLGSKRYYIYATTANATVATTILNSYGLPYDTRSSLQTGVNEYMVVLNDNQRDQVATDINSQGLQIYFTAERLAITGQLGAPVVNIGAARTPAHSVVTTAGAGSILALAANAARKGFLLVNDSDTVMYVNVVGGAAVVNQGIRINANGGSYEESVENGNMTALAIYMITGVIGKSVLVTEFT